MPTQGALQSNPQHRPAPLSAARAPTEPAGCRFVRLIVCADALLYLSRLVEKARGLLQGLRYAAFLA